MARDMDKGTELTVRGRTRTVEEWARWRGMTVETLVWRLEHGWEAQDAVLVPVRPAAASVVVTAFGRTLTPGEWERENGVPATLIGKRIKLGWTPEGAVSRPVRSKRTARTVTVGGETLAVHEWSKRTGIPAAVISSRLSIGWTPERAVSEPIRKRRGTGRRGVVIGGERLAVREWAERTGIPANVISNRLNRGWTPERAVGTPARKRRGPDLEEITVGGETLTVHGWAERTGIPVVTISNRLNRGWTPEDAVPRLVRKEPRAITVGGERLTIRGWAEHTGIPINVISGRLYAGWSPERAVGTPARRRRRTGRRGSSSAAKG